MGEGFVSFLVLFFGLSFFWFGMDGYVVHINGEPSLCHLHLKDVVHHHLKVAGEFVRPKNMTSGSNNPSGVRKAAFHSSPSLIQMLLYPHRILNFVNRVHPISRSTTCGINGDTLWFFFVHLLMGR